MSHQSVELNSSELISDSNSEHWLSVPSRAHKQSVGFIDMGSVHLDSLSLLHGGLIEDLEVHYNCYGSLHNPAIVVLGGISASRNIHDWWGELVGAGKAINLEQFCVVGIDYIANQDSKKPILISPFDQAKIIHLVLDKLGFSKIEAIVGSSYGGMVALAFAALYPAKLEKLICIAAAHRNTQVSVAQRQIQQQILNLGIRTGEFKAAISIARELGFISYRSDQELETRFNPLRVINKQTLTFELVEYLKHQGEKFASKFDIEKYRSLSQSIDLHKVNPKDIHTQALFVAIDSDRLVPCRLVEECASSCAGETHIKTIYSQFGHDGFLLETEQLTECITPFLRSSL
ncbi:homoserine O-succinyltransferase MetX [Kangiella sp.]|uniref:homoserine O-succinyltransferase MetX n=1 Tax=Kangiella sp. TaxID=1920245 RepID=UPI003A9583A4